MEAKNFVLKPNNNQKKTKTSQKPLNGAALFKVALVLVSYYLVRLPSAPRLVSVFYSSTLLHFLQYYSYYVLH
jgi:hypothetical protein